MDYWRNAFEGRGLLYYDQTELQGVDDDDDFTSNITNPSKSVSDWDIIKPLSDFDKNITNPNDRVIDDFDLSESPFPDLLANSLSTEPSFGCVATEISNNSCKPPVSSLLGESDFGSKSGKGKSLCCTELKFEGLADSVEVKIINKLSKDRQNSSSLPVKKARKDNTCGPVFLCQVQGCDKDLSSFKEYYRRHKVCDIHSKSPNVMISGFEKRFCQQCSRFHSLDEFDDGKRSCRKRLAGHNARRRKPTVLPGYDTSVSNQFIKYCQGSQKNGGEESMGMYSNGSRVLSLLSADEWQNLSSRSSACIPTYVSPVIAPPDYTPSHNCLYHQSSSPYAANEQNFSSLTGSYFDPLGAHVVPEYFNDGAANADLNQLSAHLQRVEEQRMRNYVLMKPENYLFR